jgi:catechol 2,3-dioxygenase-like lactoylglutathione lyase family enzyme
MSTKPGSPFDTGVRTEPQKLRARTMSLSLTVKDLQKSIVWYRDQVGFHMDRSWDVDGKMAGATMLAGDVRINLNQDDGKKGPGRAMGQGFSIHLSTGQDVDQVAAAIERRGAKLDDGPSDRPWGVRSFYLTDPDGYRFGIQRPLKE